MMNKRGSGVGEMVEMVPILIIISVIAIIVFGASAAYYAYDISVRDAEARLLGRAIVDCLSPEGVLNLDNIGEAQRGEIISYCGMEGSQRFYVGVDVYSNKETLIGTQTKVASLSEGDSGLLWVRDLFGKVVSTGNAVSGWDNKNVENMVNYNPGYFSYEYSVFVVEGGKRIEGKVKVEALVNYE